jgi:hypothetical protein
LAITVQHDHDDYILDDAMAHRGAISDEIEGMPAETEAGRKAKAAVAVALIEESQSLDCMDYDVNFAYSAFLDVAGRTAA